ncbi:MAG TPA: hypothetical protein VGM56_31295 [Byssovorax sp.]
MSDDDDETEIDASPPSEIERLRAAKPALVGRAPRSVGAANPGPSIGARAVPRAPDSVDDDAKTRAIPTKDLVPTALHGMSLDDRGGTIDDEATSVTARKAAADDSLDRTVRPYEQAARRYSSAPPRAMPSEAAPTLPRAAGRASRPDLDFSTGEDPSTLDDRHHVQDDATAIEGDAARVRAAAQPVARGPSFAQANAGASFPAPPRAPSFHDLAPPPRTPSFHDVAPPAPAAALASPPKRSAKPAAPARAAGTPPIVWTVVFVCAALTLTGLAMLAYLHHRHML